jgi:hypothetical protein
MSVTFGNNPLCHCTLMNRGWGMAIPLAKCQNLISKLQTNIFKMPNMKNPQLHGSNKNTDSSMGIYWLLASDY